MCVYLLNYIPTEMSYLGLSQPQTPAEVSAGNQIFEHFASIAATSANEKASRDDENSRTAFLQGQENTRTAFKTNANNATELQKSREQQAAESLRQQQKLRADGAKERMTLDNQNATNPNLTSEARLTAAASAAKSHELYIAVTGQLPDAPVAGPQPLVDPVDPMIADGRKTNILKATSEIQLNEAKTANLNKKTSEVEPNPPTRGGGGATTDVNPDVAAYSSGVADYTQNSRDLSESMRNLNNQRGSDAPYYDPRFIDQDGKPTQRGANEKTMAEVFAKNQIDAQGRMNDKYPKVLQLTAIPLDPPADGEQPDGRKPSKLKGVQVGTLARVMGRGVPSDDIMNPLKREAVLSALYTMSNDSTEPYRNSAKTLYTILGGGQIWSPPDAPNSAPNLYTSPQE